MKGDDDFLAFLQELLEPLGRTSVRRMFGGHGLYCDGLFIAIVFDGLVYLKVDEQTRAEFVAAGSTPFSYQAGDKTIEMSYWQLPEEALDSAEQMRPWAQRAIAAATRKPALAKARRKATRKRPG